MPDITIRHPVEVKSENDETFTVAGWACVFDTPESDDADLVGDYFDAKSDLWLEQLGTSKVLLYDHAQNKAIGKRVIGRATLDPKDEGVWFEAEVTKSATYASKIRQLIDAGLMGASIGSIPHLVERELVAGKNWLKSFPAAELSLTVHPCEPRTLTVEAVKALAELEPALAALLEQPTADADEPAQPDEAKADAPHEHTDGTVHLKATSIEDIQERIRTMLRPAANPVTGCETGWTYIVQTFTDHVVVNRSDYGADSDGYWRIDYSVDAAGDVTLSNPVAVQRETTYTPIAASADAPATKAADAAEPTSSEAPEPAQESPAMSEPTTGAPEATSEQSDTTAVEIKSLRDTVAALVAKLEDEPAVKAGGIELPAIHIKADASDEVKAFEAWIRGRTLTPAMKAALNEGTAAQGGYAVPVEYSNTLITPLTNLSYLRRAGARLVSFSGTDAVHVPSLTYTAAAVLTAEAQSYDEKEPTMGEVVFTPYKYTRIAKASEELASDSRFDLWGQILSPDFAQAFAQAENTAFTAGTGSSQPQGIVTGTSTGVTAASATAVTADEVINTYFALDYKYRDNAKWMMADGTLAALRKLKDGASRYLWEPGLNGDTQGLFLGKPVITNNSMDGLTAAKDAILFGDFSYFWIGQWPGLSMQRLGELYAANGQIGWRAFSRFDSHVMLTAAFTKLTTHA